MPVYHFIFHSHGSWMPDRPEGYYKHDAGWKAPNKDAAGQYQKNMKATAVEFTHDQQKRLIHEATKAQSFQRFTLYAAATDPTHVHIVVAWRDDREPIKIRAELKSSLTRMLNAQYHKKQWFVAKGGQIPVCKEEHLSDLVHDYLPKHTLYWYYKSEGSD